MEQRTYHAGCEPCDGITGGLDLPRPSTIRFLVFMQSFLEYITETFRYSFGRFWDPGYEIRSAIKVDLAMISSRDLDWQKLITETEWLGKMMEEEGDKARKQQAEEESRDSGGRGNQP